MKLKCLILVVMSVVVVGAQEEEKKDHNGDAHNALCALLKAAVTKWGNGGQGLSEPLKKALHQTIFGNESGGSLETLRNGFPKDYDEVVKQSDSRNFACGQHYNDPTVLGSVHQVLRSGQSAPHDLVCLCTVGDGGWPLNETSINKLCGKTPSDLGGEEKKGWHGEGSGKPQIEATWKNVTVPCLKEEKGKDLKQTLSDFLRRLENKSIHAYPNRYQLGKGEPSDSYACTGSPLRGVCVEYYNSTTTLYPLPWWSELEKAIQKDEEIQEQKKHDEEERRKKEQQNNSQQEPQTAASNSAQTTPNQAEQNKTATLHETMRRLNMTSGTSISQPSSWLLRAILLI